MAGKDKYVVEPRSDDGSLNVEYYNPRDPTEFITGITEDKLFAWYFNETRINPGQKHVTGGGATWEDLVAFLKEKGLTPRRKTW